MITHRIYILTYDNNTLNIAKSIFTDKDWAKVISINTTRYLENTMYDSWLINNKDDWKNYDYVGTLSWRSFQKIPLPNLYSDNSQRLITEQNPDIVTFYHTELNLIDQATQSHGNNFSKIWHYILKKVGFSDDQIFDPNISTFFSNYWMTKPEIMIKYIEFFAKIKDIIENDNEIKPDLYHNARYGTYVSGRRLIEIFGVPYHPLYIFVLERLPCFFFHQQHKMLRYPYGL